MISVIPPSPATATPPGPPPPQGGPEDARDLDLFSDLGKLEDKLPPVQRQGLHDSIASSPNPDEDKAAAVNTWWVAKTMGQSPDHVAAGWPILRDQVGSKLSGQEMHDVGDTQLYGIIGKYLQKQAAQKVMIGQVAAHMGQAAYEGETDWLHAYQGLQPTLASNGAYDVKDADRWRTVAQAAFQHASENASVIGPAAKALSDYFAAAAQKGPTDSVLGQREAAIAHLESLSPQDQAAALHFAGLAASGTIAKGREAGTIETPALDEAFERGMSGLVNTGVAGMSRAGAAAGSLPKPFGLGQSAAGPGTASRMDLENSVDETYQNVANPLPHEHWWQKMGLGFAQMAPPLIAAAAQPEAGITLLTASMADQNARQYEAQGIPREKAFQMGLVTGGVQAALMKSLGGFLVARTPMAQALFESEAGPTGLGQIAARALKIGAVNTAVVNFDQGMIDAAPDAIQKVAAIFSKAIPDVHWADKKEADGSITPGFWSRFSGARLDTFLTLLPLALPTTGHFAFSESARYKDLLAKKNAAAGAGISTDAAKAAAAAPTPETASTIIADAATRAPVPDAVRQAGIDAMNRKMATQSPKPEPIETTTKLGDLIGQQVRYAGYDGTLVRDDEGNFMVLRSVREKGQPKWVELADTGKSVDVMAKDVGVQARSDLEKNSAQASQEPDGNFSVKDADGRTIDTANSAQSAAALVDLHNQSRAQANEENANQAAQGVQMRAAESPVSDAIYGPAKPAEAAGMPKTVAKVGSAISASADEIKRIFAPQTRSPEAQTAAGILREHGATLAQRTDQAAFALKGARQVLGDMKPEKRMDFIDRIETGKEQPTAALQKVADVMRSILDTKRDEIRALGTGKLEHFVADYFPHIWEDPEAAGKAFQEAAGRRSLEGGKSFLKKRSIPTTKQGIEMGLKPVSDNPVDLVMLKAREMDKYILGQRVMAELKDRSLVQFVRATEKRPDGLQRIDDKISQVFGPPTIEVAEHVDKAVMDGLQKVLDALNIKHERLSSVGRGKLGVSYTGQNRIATKGGTELSIVVHEVGHQVDLKFGFGKVVNNPENAAELKRLAEMRGYESASQKAYARKPEELTAAALEAYVGAKERFKEEAPKTFAAVEKFLGEHDELKPLREIKPSIEYQKQTYEKAHGGLLKLGEYAAPEPVATLINNYLSPGLRGSQLFRNYLTAANSLNQFQLGLSAFHLAFTTLDTMISKFALGLEHAASGDMTGFAKSVAATPAEPFTNFFRGNKVLREWYAPGSQGEQIGKIVDGLRAAGGRAKMDAFYQTSIADGMLKAFKEGNMISGVAKAPFALVESAAKPIMEWIVPRQKLGIFAELARRELSNLPAGADQADLRMAMGRAWDSVDNRMGQMVYDNLFFNKAAKDLSMASLRSVGWNLGTLREIGGGIIDAAAAGKAVLTGNAKDAEFTHRMAYTAALPIITGLIGGMTQYLLSGQPPQELEDYFFPKTGEKDAQGRDIRLSIPTYMKDVYHYAHDPVGTVEGKVHPLLSGIVDMLNNKDYFGAPIRNAGDPFMKQLTDTGSHVAREFEPIGVSNFFASGETGQNSAERLLNFVGIVRAPRWLSMTGAEQLAQKLVSEGYGAKKPESSASGAESGKILLGLRSTDQEARQAALKRLGDMVTAGDLTSTKARNLIETAKHDFLTNQVHRLDAADAIRVYRVSTPAERIEIHDLVAEKLARSKLPEEDRKELQESFTGLESESK